MEPTFRPAPIELAPRDALTPYAPHIGGAALTGFMGAEKAGEPSLVDRVKKIPGTHLTSGEGSFTGEAFSGTVTILGGVELAGMSHISVNEIPKFETDKVSGNGGKFGTGTYFALGNLGGETAGALAAQYEAGTAVKHEAKTSGTFMIVDRKDVVAMNEHMRVALGEPEPKFKSNVRNSPHLTDNLQHFQVNGQPIDGVIILMSQAEPAAEVIIMPASTPKIEIERRRRSTDSRVMYKGRGTPARQL